MLHWGERRGGGRRGVIENFTKGERWKKDILIRVKIQTWKILIFTHFGEMEGFQDRRYSILLTTINRGDRIAEFHARHADTSNSFPLGSLVVFLRNGTRKPIETVALSSTRGTPGIHDNAPVLMASSSGAQISREFRNPAASPPLVLNTIPRISRDRRI